MPELPVSGAATSVLGMSSSSPIAGIPQPSGFPGLPAGWASEWETFDSLDGEARLFAMAHYSPAIARRAVSQDRQSPYRVAILFHGMGEHGGRYLHLPQYLQKSVDLIYTADHRGHGRSEGLRGHVERFSALADDVAMIVRRVDERLTSRLGKPEIHLIGHSLGGLIALRALQTHSDLPIRSATLSAPFLGLKVPVPLLKKSAALLLSRAWGSVHMTSELDPRHLSRDPEVVRSYQTDRLVHLKVTPRMYTEMLKTIDAALRAPETLACPTQFLIPLDDRIVDSEASVKFFERLPLSDKRLVTYPDFRHEIFNEVGKERPLDALRTWIESH